MAKQAIKEGSYGTIKRGKQQITSLKQLNYLRVHKLPHTEFRRAKSGHIYKKRVNYA